MLKASIELKWTRNGKLVEYHTIVCKKGSTDIVIRLKIVKTNNSLLDNAANNIQKKMPFLRILAHCEINSKYVLTLLQ